MQSNNAPKKTRKIANDPATGAAEVAATSETAVNSRTSQSSKAKKPETTDLGPAKHRKLAKSAEVETPAAKSISAAASAGNPAQPSHAGRPSTEDIARLAYSLWEARGHKPGSAEDDWLRAEHQLLAKR